MGRVLRFDSLSKTIAAGLRVGWATGPDALMNAIDLHACFFIITVSFILFIFVTRQGSCSGMQPASTSQVIALSLFQLWGVEGFLAHTGKISAFYKGRRDMFERALQKHLVGLAEWKVQDAGMFFWLVSLLFHIIRA